MTLTDLKQKFELVLDKLLTGSPLTDKDGNAVLNKDGTLVLALPKAAELAVIRAYIKDLADETPAAPQAGVPAGRLSDFSRRKNLPFGAAPAPETHQ